MPSGKTVSDGQPLPDDHGIKAKDLKVLIAMGRLRDIGDGWSEDELALPLVRDKIRNEALVDRQKEMKQKQAEAKSSDTKETPEQEKETPSGNPPN